MSRTHVHSGRGTLCRLGQRGRGAMSDRVETRGDERRSRRDVVQFGAAGVVGALAAGALAPDGASANDGHPLILGSLSNSSSSDTIWGSSVTGYTLSLSNSGHGIALGVTGGSTNVALEVSAGGPGAPAIVAGSAGPCPAIFAGANGAGTVQPVDIGVQGSSGASSGAGVFGENTGTGSGVHGTSN